MHTGDRKWKCHSSVSSDRALANELQNVTKDQFFMIISSEDTCLKFLYWDLRKMDNNAKRSFHSHSQFFNSTSNSSWLARIFAKKFKLVKFMDDKFTRMRQKLSFNLTLSIALWEYELHDIHFRSLFFPHRPTNNNNNESNKDTSNSGIIQEDIRRLLATGSPTLTECL